MAIATDVSDADLAGAVCPRPRRGCFRWPRQASWAARAGDLPARAQERTRCRRSLSGDVSVAGAKAPDVAWRESVGSWLSAVAHRLALAARADSARHRRREAPFATLASTSAEGRLAERYHPQSAPLFEVENRDLRRVLDDELLQLPEKYRAPVVLCDLEGRSHQEAAEQLGWPSGSMSRRLEQARALLRRRLVHRGVTLTIGLAGLGLAACSQASSRTPNAVTPRSVRAVMTTLRPLAGGVPGVTPGPRRSVMSPLRPIRPGSFYWRDGPPRPRQRSKRTIPARIGRSWRGFAFEMRQSGLQLAQATQEHDELAMLSAARRLDASCVRCHEVFGE